MVRKVHKSRPGRHPGRFKPVMKRRVGGPSRPRPSGVTKIGELKTKEETEEIIRRALEQKSINFTFRDPVTKRVVTTKITPSEQKKILKISKQQRGLVERQKTQQILLQAAALKKQGFDVKATREGRIVATKAGQTTTVSTKQTGPRELRFIFGAIPRRETKLKKFEKLTPKEKERLLPPPSLIIPGIRPGELKDRKKLTTEQKRAVLKAPKVFLERQERARKLRENLETRFGPGLKRIEDFATFVVSPRKLKDPTTAIGRITKSAIMVAIGFPFLLAKEIPAATAESLSIAETFIRKETRPLAIRAIEPARQETAKLLRDPIQRENFIGGIIGGSIIAGLLGGVVKTRAGPKFSRGNAAKSVKSNLGKTARGVKKVSPKLAKRVIDLQRNPSFVNRVVNKASRLNSKVSIRLKHRYAKPIRKGIKVVKRVGEVTKKGVRKATKPIRRLRRITRKGKERIKEAARKGKIALRRPIGKIEIKALEAKALIRQQLAKLNLGLKRARFSLKLDIKLTSKRAIADGKVLIAKLNKAVKAGANKTALNLIKQINRNTPFKVKIIRPPKVTKPTVAKPRLPGPRMIDIAKRVLAGKLSLNRLPKGISRSRVRSAMRKLLRKRGKPKKLLQKPEDIVATIKFIKGRPRIKTELAKRLRGRKEAFRTEFKRLIKQKKEQLKAKADRAKSEDMVLRLRQERDAGLIRQAQRQALLLQRRIQTPKQTKPILTKSINNLKTSNQLTSAQNKQINVLKQKGQNVIRKFNQASKKPTKSNVDSLHSASRSASRSGQELVTLLKKPQVKTIAKGRTITQIFGRQISTAKLATVLAATFGALSTMSRATFVRQATGVIIIPKEKIKTIAIQKQIPVQIQKIKEIAKEETITIPDQTVRSKTAQDLVRIINTILLSVAGAAAFTAAGRKGILKMTRTSGGLFRLRRRLLAYAKRKRFVYLPDMYSIIFGFKAKPKQRIKLLKVGRVFTGIERRALVK